MEDQLQDLFRKVPGTGYQVVELVEEGRVGVGAGVGVLSVTLSTHTDITLAELLKVLVLNLGNTSVNRHPFLFGWLIIAG